MSALDQEFWRIILRSWTFYELDCLTLEAREVEICSRPYDYA